MHLSTDQAYAAAGCRTATMQPAMQDAENPYTALQCIRGEPQAITIACYYAVYSDCGQRTADAVMPQIATMSTS